MAPEGTRILVVEDDRDVAQLVQLLLEEEGYKVSAAVSGEAGLSNYFTYGADLVLLDVKIPGMDGWEVCHNLRLASTVPIVMMTGCARPADIANGLSLGANGYICKPFGAAELLSCIHGVLQRHCSRPQAES